MRWEGNRESENLEDRRSSSGGGGGFSVGGRGIGIGTIVIALIASVVFGINPLTVIGVLGGMGGEEAPQARIEQQGPDAGARPGDAEARFISTVLADTEDVWNQVFTGSGAAYREPKLVLFRGSTQTACGRGQAAMGPFYCPQDEKVYIDLGFYDMLKTRMGAPGDFAQAYVVAHEVGHHVQKLLGVTEKVDSMRGRVSEEEFNQWSVRLELQADCFAGVWAHKAQRSRQILEDGDIEEAMNAAARIGDDALQKQSQGYVVPESFTHGSSRQRMTWFQRGIKTGDLQQCNTFQAQQL